jgi:hypothetical protein
MNPSRPGASIESPALPWVRLGLYLLASRFFLYVLANLSVYIVTPGPAAFSKEPLDLFNHWDTHWYLTVARQGYAPTTEGAESAAFFPLYPLAVHAATWVCRDPRIAGYLVSNLALFASCLLLWKTAVRDDRPEVADRAVLFFLFCPVAFFYSTIYSESLFFLLMLATVWFATERRWLPAGGCGFLGALTRPVGALLPFVLAAAFLGPYLRRGRENVPPWPAPDAPAFLAGVVLPAAGLGVYSAYLGAKLGDPLAFLHAQAHWFRHFSTPWHTLFRIEYSAFYAVWFRAAVVMAFVVLVLGFVVRLRPLYLFLSALYLVFYLCTEHLESVPRFLSVLFPFYLIIARVAVRWPRLEPLLLAGTVMLLTLSLVLFVGGYWLT